MSVCLVFCRTLCASIHPSIRPSVCQSHLLWKCTCLHLSASGCRSPCRARPSPLVAVRRLLSLCHLRRRRRSPTVVMTSASSRRSFYPLPPSVYPQPLVDPCSAFETTYGEEQNRQGGATSQADAALSVSCLAAHRSATLTHFTLVPCAFAAARLLPIVVAQATTTVRTRSGTRSISGRARCTSGRRRRARCSRRGRRDSEGWARRTCRPDR